MRSGILLEYAPSPTVPQVFRRRIFFAVLRTAPRMHLLPEMGRPRIETARIQEPFIVKRKKVG